MMKRILATFGLILLLMAELSAATNLLDYEKRVARNRFVFLVVVLVLMLWGILAVIFQR